jgi:hypothetical protein
VRPHDYYGYDSTTITRPSDYAPGSGSPVPGTPNATRMSMILAMKKAG